MSMRYAGFMAGMREDRLIKEQREDEDDIRNKDYQRQLERDEAAHKRQLDLLDIRHKNAITLSGIAENKAKKAAATKLKNQVNALISVQNLPDTPAVRAELANGLTLYGKDDFMKLMKDGTIRVSSASTAVTADNPDTSIPAVEGVEAPTVGPVEVSATPSAATADTPEDDTSAALSDTTALPLENQTEEGLGSPPAVPERIVSYNNLPFIKLEDFAGLEADALAQQIRLLEQKGYTASDLQPLKSELEFVTAAEKDPESPFIELIGEADSFGKLNALQARLDTDYEAEQARIDSLSPEELEGLSSKELFTHIKEFDERSALVTKAVDRLIETNRTNAEKDGEPYMFYPLSAEGTIGQDGSMITQRDGKYYYPDGGEVDVSKGKVLPQAAHESFVRNYNVQSQKVATVVSEGVNAVQSLANYRELVIKAPQGLNKFISIGGQLVGQANSIKSALQGVNSGEYGYSTFENRVMSAFRDLSADDARIARAQLRAAYAMAAFSGSSGQALSDRELIANLEAVGRGLSDPRKVVGLINDNMNEVVTMTEQKRSTSFNSFIASDDMRNTMSQTPIGMNFENYLETGIINENTKRQYLDALNGRLDYDFGPGNETGDGGPPDISSMTFEEFKEDLKERSLDTYNAATEDELRTFFKNNGGRL